MSYVEVIHYSAAIYSNTKSIADCLQRTSSPAICNTLYPLGKWERANNRPEKSTL